MSRRKFDNLKGLYDELISARAEYEPIWFDISRYVGISVSPEYTHSRQPKGQERDQYVDDPTAALSVNQAADYLQGIFWGTGEDALSLEPADWVLQRSDRTYLCDYFKFRTDQLLNNMNHSESGLNSAMKCFFPDQVAFGNSGIGAFKNSEFENGREETPYIFRSYGVDNTAIDEGRNGLVEVIFVTHQWRVSRIVSEFEEVFDDLPKVIKEAYANNKLNEEFTIIQAVYPREDFQPHLKGKRGAKYKGSWFMKDDSKKVFFEEDYRKKPIAFARAIKIRGEIWGRSSGTILINSIKAVNYMFSKTVEILEKMASPSLGIWNNSLFGDSALDTSADGLVVFNQAMMGNAQTPVFPIHDVGNPEGIIKVLLPYLNDKIATGFKIDVLLDFSGAKEMTARESMMRYNIRGRSLSGILQQIKIEEGEPLVHRCIQLEDDMGLAGVDPYADEGLAKLAKAANNAKVIIPDIVLQAMKEGRQWYKIKWNNELDRLSKTQAMERVIQAVNAILLIGSAFPTIIEAVKWYDIWRDVNKYLGVDYIKDEKEFEAIIKKQIEMREGMMQIEAMKAGATIGKDTASAKKNAAESKSINSGAAA
jgi:hypothetical protein